MLVRTLKKEVPGLETIGQGSKLDVWPNELIIVSHTFKRSRFLDLHVPTIGPPVGSVAYIGIDPALDESKLAEIVEGDRLRGYGAWKDDLRGTGRLLTGKRLGRGWDEAVFIARFLHESDFWDDSAKEALATLVRGEPDATWPYSAYHGHLARLR